MYCWMEVMEVLYFLPESREGGVVTRSFTEKVTLSFSDVDVTQ